MFQGLGLFQSQGPQELTKTGGGASTPCPPFIEAPESLEYETDTYNLVKNLRDTENAELIFQLF